MKKDGVTYMAWTKNNRRGDRWSATEDSILRLSMPDKVNEATDALELMNYDRTTEAVYARMRQLARKDKTEDDKNRHEALMLNARDKFRIDDRVVLSKEAMRSGVCKSVTLGKVVGFSVASNCVRVLRDGRKQPSVYHCKFWDRV